MIDETGVTASYNIRLSIHERRRLADGDRVLVDLPDGTEIRLWYDYTDGDLLAIQQGNLKDDPVGTPAEHLERALQLVDEPLARYHIRSAMQYNEPKIVKADR